MLENHILNFTAEFSISNQQQHSIWKVSNDLFKHLKSKSGDFFALQIFQYGLLQMHLCQ